MDSPDGSRKNVATLDMPIINRRWLVLIRCQCWDQWCEIIWTLVCTQNCKLEPGACLAFILMQNVHNQIERVAMQKNQKGWILAIGLLLILIACVVAYVGTMPAEANL